MAVLVMIDSPESFLYKDFTNGRLATEARSEKEERSIVIFNNEDPERITVVAVV